MEYLLDTNIIIDWFTNGPSQPFLQERLTDAKTVCSTSWICLAEFLVKARRKEREAVFGLLDRGDLQLYDVAGFDLLALTSQARRATNLPLPDCVIVATAHLHGLTLLTSDNDLARRGKRLHREIIYALA